MKSTIAISAILIAASCAEAFSFKNALKHVFKREAPKDKCLKANNSAYGWANINDANVPPCWIENGGKFDCYEYADKNTKKCDNWAGMFDIHNQQHGGPPAETCDHGNMGTLCNTKKEKCPDCWVKNGNKYDCYVKSSGKCPWGGMIDISQ
ncbi:hypothetical protein K502DRAFT_325969 [Neoconidiobolus thromboides FSU 785]|nr:hypothetical protein K502DRAFT_326389 [Neoconidiobolus thromboides FSU 785]KAI9292108.1 hypothetical protein K502DRAFT_325969 [Neoconidiobolus thromboides FSU 785]